MFTLNTEAGPWCRAYSHSCMQTACADLLAFVFPYGRQFSLPFCFAIPAPHPPQPPPPFVIWDPRSILSLALALNRFPHVTRSGQMASPEEGIQQTSSLQHRKQGLMLPYSSFPQEMIVDMFLRTLREGKGKTGRGNIDNCHFCCFPNNTASSLFMVFCVGSVSLMGPARSNSTFAAAALLTHCAGE